MTALDKIKELLIEAENNRNQFIADKEMYIKYSAMIEAYTNAIELLEQ